MARAKKTAAQATPVTVDVLDLITDKLNELGGIAFARDAWEDKAPDQYGVVEMTGAPLIFYADGHPTDAVYQVQVTLYVTGADDTWADAVMAKLQALEDANPWLDLGFRLTAHQYLYDIDKVQWIFQGRVSAPLMREG